MNPWTRKLGIVVIMEAMTMVMADKAGAQPVFGFGAWQGDVELGSVWEHQQTRTDNAPLNEDARRRYDERLSIRNQGFYLLDPRLLTGNLGLSYGLFQDKDRFNDDERAQDGRLIGYSFDAGLLSEQPYSGRVFATRNQNVTNREFGGRSDLTLENRGGSFRLRDDSFLRDWGIPYFSSTLGAREEHTQEVTDILGQRFARDETRHIMNVEANKGFETADINLSYEATDSQDSLRPQSAYQTQSANLASSLDFGSRLNRRWDSRLLYSDYTSKSQQTFYYSLDEGLRIEHNEDLSTNYRYVFVRVGTETASTTTQSGTVTAQQRLYRNLNTTYKLQGMRSELPSDQGERTNYSGQLDLNYQRTLAPGQRVFARLGGRYQIDDNALKVSRIDVIDEPHVAPSPLGGVAGFALSNSFVLTPTVVVVDTRGGVRLLTTPGVDYDILQEGDFIKIIPLATSAVILAGDPLVVSYSYEVAPSIRFSTAAWWLSGGIDFSWIALSYAHEAFDQSLLGGQDAQFLDSQNKNTARVEMRAEGGSVRGTASAAYEILDSRHLAYNRWQYGQFLSYRPRYNLTLGIDAQESFTEYTLPVRESKTRSVRFTLDGVSPSGWYTNAFAGVRVAEDSQVPAETIREAGLRARRTIGLLDILPSLTWSERERHPVQNTDRRIELRVIRRFL